MGYRIDYPGVGKGKKTRRPRRAMLTGVAFFLFLWLVHRFWPEGWQVLSGVLWPKNTAVAVQTLVEQLKTGTSAAEALAVFCQSLVEGSGEMVP